jgi:hypothetical protein
MEPSRGHGDGSRRAHRPAAIAMLALVRDAAPLRSPLILSWLARRALELGLALSSRIVSDRRARRRLAPATAHFG